MSNEYRWTQEEIDAARRRGRSSEFPIRRVGELEAENAALAARVRELKADINRRVETLLEFVQAAKKDEARIAELEAALKKTEVENKCLSSWCKLHDIGPR